MRLTATLTIILGMAGAGRAQDKPSQAEQATILAGIREYAGNYTRSLPNFTATQNIQSVTQSLIGGPGSSPMLIEEHLSIADHRESHKVVKVDGKAVSYKDETGLGQYSRGEFGNLLAAIFSPDAKAGFELARTASVDGRAVHILNFKVPATAGYELQERTRTTRVAYEGQVWADAQTNAIMRVQFACIDIPAASSYKALDLSVEYKEIPVAGKAYILPAQNHLRIQMKDEKIELSGTYKEYQRFTAEATPKSEGGSK